ncbi:MAG: restriction endonuclease [Verrucomicrobiales bacterium]|nr:restriction endonuclease [Verrucomicrobiales bacterium]
MLPQVYAFAKITDDDARRKVYNEISNGRSRFGMWDQDISLRDEYYGPNDFLLRITSGDWIVHVNSPEWGQCVAVQAVGEYQFDDGIECSWGRDFHNFIPVDPDSIIEFDRNDPNVIPSVNLAPLRRGQRVLQVEDFIRTLDNLRTTRFEETDSGLKGLVHLKEKMEEDFLPRVTEQIHRMNRSKEFERFLHRVFDSIPNVVSIQNGFGWGTDHGADLIVEFQNPIVGVSLTSKLVVQAKSYEGDHYDLGAVDQLIEGIKKYDADGGLLITTAQKTESLEDRMQQAAEETGKQFDLMAGNDVARFVIRHAPELLIGSD